MKVVYTKGHLPNGCPTCDSPSFNDGLTFDEIEDKVNFLMQIWNERHEFVYGYIYSTDGTKLIEVYATLGRHSITGMQFKTVWGNFKTEDNGYGITVIVETPTPKYCPKPKLRGDFEIFISPKETTVGQAPIGLLLLKDSGEFILKTEYKEHNRSTCYIVSSGEYYHGEGDDAVVYQVTLSQKETTNEV